MLAVSEVNGTWQNMATVPGAAALGTTDPTMTSVSCWSAGNCVAVGAYSDAANNQQVLTVSQSGGSWQNVQEMPGTAALNTGGNAWAGSVSCSPSGSCAAGGFYSTASGGANAFVVSGSGGGWGSAQPVPGLTALAGSADTGSVVKAVACAPSGGCTAAGSYGDSSGKGQAFVVSGSGGWGSAQQVPGTAALNAGGGAEVDYLSCPSGGNCSAVGSYTDSAGATDPFLVSEAGGSWQSAQQMPGTSVLTGGGTANSVIPESLSCSAAGDCVLGGSYEYAPMGYAFSAFLESQAGGTWGDPVQVPGVAYLNTSWNAATAAVSCPPGGGCSAVGSYSNPAGEPFVVSQSGGGCQQVTLPDGRYEFGGCVTQQDGGTLDVTSTQSNIDGLSVSASAADQVSYDDGGTNGYAVTSSGVSTLALSLNGTLIPVYTGKLHDSLAGPITLSLPARPAAGPAAAGPSVAGLPITGKLTFTPQLSGGKPTGTATATATTTLPGVLGGGKATLTATSAVGKGLTGVTVTTGKASFLQLFKLTKVTLSYKQGAGATAIWNVKATVVAGATATPLSGSLTYSGGKLSGASLSLGKISLAGLVTFSRLTIGYHSGTWTGTAAIGTGKTARTAAITLGFSGTTLSSGSISATNISLLGVLKVSTFRLRYAAGTWQIAATGARGSGASGAIKVTAGVITAASLTVTRLSYRGKFTVASAGISYSENAPNSACTGVRGTEIWCGGWKVLFPSASVVTGVSGKLAVANEVLASGTIGVSGNIPLLDGIFLTSFTGKVKDNPPPTTITGNAGLRFGPKIKGIPLIAFNGTLTRALPGGTTSGAYYLHGTLSILSKLKGEATVNVPGNGAPTTIQLAARISLGKASASGNLHGSFTSHSLTLGGGVRLKVFGHTIGGSLRADGTDIAACGTYNGSKIGFEYVWHTESVSLLHTKECRQMGL